MDSLDGWVQLTTAAIVGVMLVLFLGKLFLFMNTARQHLSWQSLAAALRSVCCSSLLETEDGELRQQLETRLLSMRLQSARVASFVWGLLSLISGLVIVIGDFGSAETLVNVELRGPRLLLLILLMPAALLPDKLLISETRCAILHMMVALTMSWFALVPATPSGHARKMVAASVVAVGITGLCPRIKLSIISNSCISACLIFSELFLMDSANPTSAMVLNELMLSFLRFCTSFCGIRMMERSVKREVEASFGQCRQSAVSALLGMLCDVSVDMNERGLLKAHSQKLAGMLMHGPGRCLQGESLLSFMPETDDHDHFQEVLQRTRESGGIEMPEPSTLSVRLRDSIGNRIKCLLFHVPYVGIDGLMHHLVGLREDVEFSKQLDPDCFVSQTPSGHRDAPAGVLRPEIAQRLHKIGGTGILSGAASVTSGSARSGFDGGFCGRRQDVAIAVEKQAPDLSQSMDVFFMEAGLPVRCAADPLLQDLALERPLDDFEPELGDLLPDFGERLGRMIQATIDTTKNEGSVGIFGSCLGEWEFARGIGDSSQGSEVPPPRLVRRIVWLKFFLPLAEHDSRPHVSLSLSAAPTRQRRSTGRGTSVSSSSQSLSGAKGDATSRGTLPL